MLSTQETYIHYLDELHKIIKSNLSSKDIIKNIDFFEISDSIKNCELLIPVIGAFSSGKSTLINSFIERSLLPVGITPETALAAELHYSKNEHIEAIKADDSIDEYEINQMGVVTQNAQKYKSLKIFIESEQIKAIEPLILVDMPGFDSPLDSHNQAIMEYLDKGVHYIALTSIEDGTITRSMERQLLDIKEYGRDLSFFVSKSNLRADTEVQEVVSVVEEQLEELFDEEIIVNSIDDNSGENLKKLLFSIEPEKLTKRIFKGSLESIHASVIDTLDTTIIAYNNDKEDNEKAIDSLKQGLVEINRKKEEMILGVKGKYSNPKINSIIEAVGSDISNAKDELASSYISGGKEALNRAMIEVVRHSLIINIKESMTELSEVIVGDFSLSLKELENLSSDLGINDEWIEKTTEAVTGLLTASIDGIGKLIKDNTKHLGKTIATILSVTTNILSPVIELLIIFFADTIINFFKDEKAKERQQKEKLYAVILTELVPNIKRKLKTELPSIYNQQVEQVIKSIADSFELTINEKKEKVAIAEKERQINIDQIGRQVSELETVRESINKLGEKIF